ncbi:MAG: 3-oxocholest-4-en-26-oyl-CoA dehydrogenase beta subunit [Frankiales bacterium]|jgi:alkylation response protein AidB-like acyl-CoA dehydrogenase|nr:3-oxocholest-4-en-26-oyl-CoA dehydrogenase beta subunit [Frankiales bacterium]
MDFSLSDEQEALRGLAGDFLARRATPERLTELEAEDSDWLDRELWRELGTAGLLGAGLPEQYGGGGAGFTEVILLCEQVGAHVAHAPVWSSIVCAAMPIAQFGTPEQTARDLPGVIAGESVLTAALIEPGNDDPRRPTTRAHRDGDRWALDGVKTCVPLGTMATRIVVPAMTDDGPAVFLVDPAGSGLTLEAQRSTSLEPQALLGLDSATGEPLGTPADEVLDWLIDRAMTGLAATQAGICDRAVRMSAEYTTGREQFGRSVATFQAVGHRLADAYTDALAVQLATWQAVWRLSEGLPAADAVAVAKWWSAEAGHRVTRAAQHVHGGVGVDVTYPLHRYTRWATQIALTLGGSARHARTIGKRLAEEPA